MNMGNVKGFRNVVITSQEFNFFLLMVERFSCNANNFEAVRTILINNCLDRLLQCYANKKGYYFKKKSAMKSRIYIA